MKRKTRAAAKANAETTVENETVDDPVAEADQDEQVSNEIAAETTSDVADDVDVSNEEGADDENQTDGNPDDEKAASSDEKGENDSEIDGVLANPLFEPVETVKAPIENFSLDNLGDEDLDFEPDIDENATKTTQKSDNSNWTENISSPGKVEDINSPPDCNDTVETIDEVIISDTDDIDELGDKIDAAYPGKSKDIPDDEESDEEKRGWRSEKKQPDKSVSSGSKSKSSVRTRSPPRRRRISPPRSRVPRRRSRSSSIEIVSVGATARGIRRYSPLPNGRRLSRSRSRERYFRRKSGQWGHL